MNKNKLVSLTAKLSLLGAVAVMAGCASVAKVPVSAGDVDAALVDLGKPSSDTDLLHYLEKGELLRRKGERGQSTEALLVADGIVRKWEDEAKSGVSVVAEKVGSVLINDRIRSYDGRDYEKVLVNTRIAVSHLANKNWDLARTEVKKMHEREAVVAELRSKKLEEAKSEASSKGLKVTGFKEINGYPVETLDNPEVNALRNSYESAYANYLASFVYEALGEGGLAAAGYRKAIELKPNEKTLTQALEGLDSRIARGGEKRGMVDTLFLIEAGNAPKLESVQLPIMLPMPSTNGVQFIATPLSWPTLGPLKAPLSPRKLSINNTLVIDTALLSNVDLMLRKAISEEMPGIIVRSSIRAISRGLMQKALFAKSEGGSGVAATEALAGLFATTTSLLLEQADIRSWRNVPGEYAIARATLPLGKTTVTINDLSGQPHTFEYDSQGRYGAVIVNVNQNYIEVATSSIGENAAIAEPPPPVPPATQVKPSPPAKSERMNSVPQVRKKSPAN